MNENQAANLQFNALTDEWIPLLRADGETEWASPVEILCGEKDGIDLDYPRDDFRIYARLLLSALVQALFPARTKAELSHRIATPLSRADVLAIIKPVHGDFDLFGPTPFLQVVPPSKAPVERGAAPFVFPGEDLFRARVPVDAISLPIALVAIFIEQTYAGGAGRGYGAGPAGQPGALTLVDPGNVRRAAWANTLTLEGVETYAPDTERPWANAKRAAQRRASIGLVGGLFFQPRGIWLLPAGTGTCSFSGIQGPLVRLSPFLRKSELSPRVSGTEDLWQHPCAPLVVKSQGIAAIRLHAERPAWTGLAQLLDPLSRGNAKKKHPKEGPAPVLVQWLSLPERTKRPRLLVLDFKRDKANVKRRFFESFPLTDSLLGRRETIEQLRALVLDAQDVQRCLSKALTRAHDDRKQGGLALADAESSFWTNSEGAFLDWLATTTSIDETTEVGDAAAERTRKAMGEAIRRTALGIFDSHVTLSEFDPRKQERVAKARRNLGKALYPRPKAKAKDLIHPSSTEVAP